VRSEDAAEVRLQRTECEDGVRRVGMVGSVADAAHSPWSCKLLCRGTWTTGQSMSDGCGAFNGLMCGGKRRASECRSDGKMEDGRVEDEHVKREKVQSGMVTNGSAGVWLSKKNLERGRDRRDRREARPRTHGFRFGLAATHGQRLPTS
jgi:hypothetical protein